MILNEIFYIDILLHWDFILICQTFCASKSFSLSMTIVGSVFFCLFHTLDPQIKYNYPVNHHINDIYIVKDDVGVFRMKWSMCLCALGKIGQLCHPEKQEVGTCYKQKLSGCTRRANWQTQLTLCSDEQNVIEEWSVFNTPTTKRHMHKTLTQGHVILLESLWSVAEQQQTQCLHEGNTFLHI